ncbi:MAG: acyl-CoA dehydrogenase family protein [Acidimicrobiia bacterium]
MLIERARAVVPLLDECREHSEEHARPAPEVIAACQQAGLFAMTAPEEAGGLEAPFPDRFEAMALIAEADPGVAWMIGNSSGLCGLAARMDDDVRAAVFEPPLGPFCQGLSPSGRLEPDPQGGGYWLEGTWPVLTGVLDARWAMLISLLPGPDDVPQLRMAVVNTADLEVKQTWRDAVAIRGSGSHEVTLPRTLLPANQVIDPAAPLHIDRPAFRLTPIVAGGGVATGLAVGFLRAAITSAHNELATKIGSISGQRAGESAITLELMAETLVATNHLFYGTKGALEELTDYLDRGETPPIELRATLAGSVFRGLDVARDLISRLYARSSRAAFFRGHALQRALADVHAMSYGWETIRHNYQQVGRVALNLEPIRPVL